MKRLRRLLDERSRDVIAEWTKRAAVRYPEGLQDLLARGGDGFQNPAKGVLRDTFERLLPAVAGDAEDEELAMVLDTAIRLHAVQGLKPSQAVGFVFALKPAVRHVLGREGRKHDLEGELLRFDEVVDRAALVAFDGYMGCREQALRLRTADERRATLNYLRHAGLAIPKDEASAEAGEGGTA